MLDIRNSFYPLSSKKISFVTQDSIPGKQGDPFTRQNKIIEIIIEEIQKIFYEKTYSQKSKNSREIFPYHIFL
jgi:hypothetical protein